MVKDSVWRLQRSREPRETLAAMTEQAHAPLYTQPAERERILYSMARGRRAMSSDGDTEECGDVAATTRVLEDGAVAMDGDDASAIDAGHDAAVLVLVEGADIDCGVAVGVSRAETPEPIFQLPGARRSSCTPTRRSSRISPPGCWGVLERAVLVILASTCPGRCRTRSRRAPMSRSQPTSMAYPVSSSAPA